MSHLFLSFIMILISLFPCYSQCKCDKIDKEDGSKSFNCQTLPIAFDNSTQIGITVASDYEQHYLALTIRFKYASLDLSSELSIRLQNNKVFKFDLINSGLSMIGNSQVTQGLFALTKNSTKELTLSSIKTVSFKLTDNIVYIYESKTNNDVLIKQIKCLPELINIDISKAIIKSESLDEKNGFQSFKLGMSIDNFPNFQIIKKGKAENDLLDYYELDKPNIDILGNKIDYISFYCIDKEIVKIYVRVHYDRNNELYDLLKEIFGLPADYHKVDKKLKDLFSHGETEIKGIEAKWIGNKLTLEYRDLQPNSETSLALANKMGWSTRNISLEYKVSNYDDILRDLKSKKIRKSAEKL